MMRFPVRLAALSALALLASTNAFAAGAAMNPGLWEMTSTSEIPGMPMAMPPMTSRLCFTAKDIEENRAMRPAQGDCKLKDVRFSGKTANWKAECTGPHASTAEGSATFAGDTFKQTMKMKMLKGEMAGMPMTMNMVGRRVGDCGRN